MLATYPQYPQPLIATPFGAALFAPPGNSLFAHEPAFAGLVQPGPAYAPFGASVPLSPTYAMTPGYPFPALPQTYISPQAPFAAAQQLVLALAQLAQQVSMQSVVGQQICSALQQLTQQIQVHSLPALPGLGIGYAQLGSPFAGVTSPFIGTPQPAWQTWAGQRTPTIQ
jgi:hypothetical protein